MLEIVAAAGGLSSAAVLVRYWLRLRFLRHVYDKGGAKDLAVAGRALRRNGPEAAEAASSGGRPTSSAA